MDSEAPLPYFAGDKFKSSPSVAQIDGDYVIMAGSFDDNMYFIEEAEKVVMNYKNSVCNLKLYPSIIWTNII